MHCYDKEKGTFETLENCTSVDETNVERECIGVKELVCGPNERIDYSTLQEDYFVQTCSTVEDGAGYCETNGVADVVGQVVVLAENRKCFDVEELICGLNRNIDSRMADEMTVPPDSESRETPAATYLETGRLNKEIVDWSSLGRLSPKHKEEEPIMVETEDGGLKWEAPILGKKLLQENDKLKLEWRDEDNNDDDNDEEEEE